MNVAVENLPRTITMERLDGVPQVVMVDQRLLPERLEFVRTSDWRSVIDAVKTLVVRGAPALGVAGAAVVMLRAFEFVAASATDTANAAACQADSEDAYACLMCQRGPKAREGVDDAQRASDGLSAEGVRDEGEARAESGSFEEVGGVGGAGGTERTFTCEALDAHRTFVLDERSFDPELYAMALEFAGKMAKDARPTAVNLGWGVDRALDAARRLLASGEAPAAIAGALYDEVAAIAAEDEAANRAIGRAGVEVLRPLAQRKGRPLRILTHCNAGSLATAFYGTALGVVYAAAEEGLVERVYADETRPVGQGARLTAWELSAAGVPVTLLCDNMAATVMAQGLIDAVIVGADRITANGDVANKIGTLGVAILARYFGIPFYVAAPESTIDHAMATGCTIPIEERDGSEVLPNSIKGVEVYNPAFDVTPASLVTAIITEHGAKTPSQI